MTRILRLLLIAAIALPAWHATAAQENVVAVSKIQTNFDNTAKDQFMIEENSIEQKIKEVPQNPLKELIGGKTTNVSLSEKSKAKESRKGHTPVDITVVDGVKSDRPLGVSLKADAVTINPPSGAVIEEWNISSTYVNNAGTSNYQGSVPTVKVAITDSEVYISGLLPYFDPSWVKGTISGSTVTFPSEQYYGSLTSGGSVYEFWFVGLEISNNQIVKRNNVTFDYDAENGKLTLNSGQIIGNCFDANAQGINAYLLNTQITRRAGTVCDGSYVAAMLPVAGSYQNNNTITEMIYSSEKLAEIGLQIGDKINAITFYSYPATNTSSSWAVPSGIGAPTYEILVGETTDAITSSTLLESHIDLVREVFYGNLPTGEETMTITFNTPYTYNGNNLIVMTYVAETATATTARWIVDEATEGAGFIFLSSSSGGSAQLSYLPKMTINYSPLVIPPRDIVVKDAEFFDAISYNWTDDDGGSHTSKLTDIATDPNQMIAMLREVYTNRTIPGNHKRGFGELGENEQYNEVDYAAVGTVMGGNPAGTGYVNDPNTFMYDDSYGWGIPTERDLIFGSYNSSATGQCFYSYLDPTEYKPNEEGVTLLLVEAVDDYKYDEMMAELEQVSGSFTNDYDYLRFFVEKSIKSVRVATEAVRTGSGFEAGTLFKIDCDKMNKFFLIAKGQLRWAFNSFLAEDNNGNWAGGTFCPYPGYIFEQNSGVNGYTDELSSFFLYHMFEQFSPVDPNSSAGKDDIYQELVNMESFGVEHDCVSVPALNHQFLMYGEESEAADCQDVRDLMFFVPDYRMMKDAYRDNGYADGSLYWQKYLNYNKVHQPTMGLYVIRQDEVTPTTQEEDYFQLQLNWRTNLDMFLPSKQQEFHLLRVVVDEETGVESYEPVYYRNENGEYTDADGNVVSEENKVPIILIMEAGEVKNYPYVYEERYEQSRQVTYAIQGRDADHFLSLQISNRMSYIIPGTDPSELLLLSDMTHYSRFDAERVRNCYSNELSMTNNDVDGLKQANLTSNTQLIISRTAQGSTEPTTVATVTFNPSNNSYTVQMANQATDATEFPECADGSRAGYHANNGNVTGNGSWTNNYQVNSNGTIDLGSLIIFDNFVQEIPADNSHPNGYTYQVTTNYECTANQPTSVFLNPGVTSTGDEVWYAWTWNNDDDGNWVLGAPQTGGVLQFASVKNNIIFARMNPAASNVPSFDGGTTWNRTGDLSTVGYMGKTFTINGWDMTGYWAGDVIYDMAHSNAFRIPIYKTSSQINGVFSQADVDGDTEGSVGVPENVEFGVGVQLSSKTEILRYDAYRWEEGEPRYSVASADGDDEQDLPPTGLAMNQGEYYTISMNPDTDNETNDEVSVANGSGTATFVDEIPGSSDVAGAYIYAPIVETFTNRGDYNTYGGPLQSSAVGKLEVQQLTGLQPMSSYYWTETVDGQEKKFAYYDIELNVPVKELPSADYQIYKVRVWRQILDESGNPAPGLLREEYATQSEDIAARMGVNGKFMFEINYDDDEQMYEFTNNAPLGSHEEVVTVTGVDGNEQTITYTSGTFGAQKLRTEGDDEQGVIDELNLNFKVRMYFTRTANLAQNGKGVAEGKDDKFYIVEQEIPVQIQGGGTITGIDVLNAKQIVSEKYYNPAGIESDKPFQGVNIVVTRYSDGSTSTVKVLK